MDQKIRIINEKEVSLIKEDFDTILVNTFFDKNELVDCSIIDINDKNTADRIKKTKELLDSSCSLLKEGGLLFVYGIPKYLPFFASHLNEKEDDSHFYLFKYWIALEYQPEKMGNLLPNSHLGILMYLKSKDRYQPNGFNINTKTVRNPNKMCTACKKDLKDWGGKKHLRNKLGTAVSDVWSDLFENIESCEKIPIKALQRLYDLVYSEGIKFLVVNQNKLLIDSKISKDTARHAPSIKRIELKEDIILADSLDFMERLYKKHPEGVFDLVFADPPYNLAKNYNGYSDEKSDRDYLDWCNKWLGLMSKILKPGGALLVLNIPKWSVNHAAYLNRIMGFRHWIIWDALSTPAGKLMPAHYSLLYYTKPGGVPKLNSEKMAFIDSRQYCLRANCILTRKQKINDQKELLSDVWHDIHRIKHKKDRDAHPCQLPIKLMDRIIELTTNEGDWVYDPFGGVGTTAISAKIKKRHYITSDIDKKYVEISKRNLSNLQRDLNGNFYMARKKIKTTKPLVSKKEIETTYISLCKKKGHLVSEQELRELRPELYGKIQNYYDDYGRLMKITRRLMEVDNVFKIASIK